MTRFLLNASAAGLLVFGFAVSAQAQSADPAQLRSIDVAFGDLDLAEEKGMTMLRKRIDHAVRKLCPARIEKGVRTLPDHRMCRREAWMSAERQLASLEGKTFVGRAKTQILAVTVTDQTS